MRVVPDVIPGPERLTGLVSQAVRAPSSHNTQPWHFAVGDDAIDVFADRTRSLPVTDPWDRELTISCGAAVLTLRTAARGAGLRAETVVLPDGPDGDRIAELRLTTAEDATIGERQRAAAIEMRRTLRGPFSDAPMPAGLTAAMADAAGREGATAVPVDDGEQRAALGELVREGDAVQFHDPHWRRELASWLHPRRRGDGLVVPPGTGVLTRAVVGGANLGGFVAARDASLVEAAQHVVMVCTVDDEPLDWVRAGMAVQRMLLVAAADGVQAGFLNQPCQVAVLRPRLRLLAGGLTPQLVLRFGVPQSAHAEPTPRRPVADVVERRPARI
ncbi:MAG: nitroreductase [Thermoleophilia bacterium]|nr:nitroreductase [Thermoleophilia bacterium]